MPRIKNAAQIHNPLADPQMPLMVPMFGGGFSFSKADRVRLVKNDPFLPHIFDGEEINMTTRLWTHGYDFYAPSEDIVFHFYADKKDEKRPSFWKVNFERTQREGKRSSARLRYLFKMAPDNEFPADLRQIGLYSMGTKRSLEQYYHLLGIDPVTKECKNLSQEVYSGRFHARNHRTRN
ncbi:hypothetical protein MHBO_003352 [Bonamia ostreae]|uniref:Uncharacterized protein n=1 Tax=Bonamia ostreae TaxID=126728 RepID=A0ABV2AQX6_9EUKA